MSFRHRNRTAAAVLETLHPRTLLSADPGWTNVYASSNFAIGPSPIAFYANHPDNPALSGATVRFLLSSDNQVGNADDVLLASSPYATSAGPIAATLPELAPGTYRFFATCDNANPISAGDLTVYANTDAPDLAFIPGTDFFGIPPAFPAGEYHGVSADVMNLGKTRADNVYVALYLSPTPTLSPDAYLVKKSAIFSADHGLPARSTNTVIFATNFPSPMPTGTYYPIFVVDPDNQVAEADETNNALVGNPIQIVPPSANISLVSVSTDPTATINPYAWTDPIPMDVTFRSTGSSQNFRLMLYLSTDDTAGNADDVLVGYTGYFNTPDSPDTVTIHTTASYSFYGQPTPITPGTYRLVAKTDTPPDITPADNIIVGPQITLIAPNTPTFPQPHIWYPVTPDFTLGSIDLQTPSTVYPNSRIWAHTDVISTPAVTAGNVAVSYALSIDDVAGNEDDIPLDDFQHPISAMVDSVHSLRTGNLTIPSSIAPGTYHLVAIVDPDNVIAETDESNNAVVGPTITVAAPPPLDLTPGPVTSTHSPIYPGYGMSLDGHPVANVPTSGPVKTAYYLSADDVIGNSDDILLGSFEETPAEPGWPNPGGIEVIPYPVLYYSDGGGFVVGRTLTIPTSVAPGTYHLISIVDPGNAFAESDETNNATLGPEVTVSAIPPLDLTVSAPQLVITPTTPYRPGSTLNLWANPESTAPLADPVKVSFYLSADDVAGNEDDILLGSFTRNARFAGAYPPGAVLFSQVFLSDSFTIPASVQAGTYHIVTTVDPDNQFVETDETNNSIVGGTITIAPPDDSSAGDTPVDTGAPDDTDTTTDTPQADTPASDLTAQLTAPTGPMRAGAAGRASLTLQNQSTSAITRKYHLTFYLSSDPTLSANDTPFYSRAITARLRPGRSATLKLKFTLPTSADAGDQYLIAVADPVLPTAKASRRANNAAANVSLRASAKITVAAPQLAASVQSVNSIPGRSNASRVTLRVTNSGTATFAGLATLTLLPDSDSTTPLANLTRRLSLKPGKHADLSLIIHGPIPDTLLATLS